MSERCKTCGIDREYPLGIGPLGACPVCTVIADRDDLAAELERVTRALRRARNWIADGSEDAGELLGAIDAALARAAGADGGER